MMDCCLQMRGIGEVLEGLIPYSQRHFSRIDRLERSTFLLDYTLTGMSVIEPERKETESRDGDSGRCLVEEEEKSTTQQDDMEPKDMSRKKRKSQKSQDRKQKKTKVAYISAAPISSQA